MNEIDLDNREDYQKMLEMFERLAFCSTEIDKVSNLKVSDASRSAAHVCSTYCYFMKLPTSKKLSEILVQAVSRAIAHSYGVIPEFRPIVQPLTQGEK